MRILFLSHYFPPEVNAPAVRTFEHCREWARCGHEVHVVTCVPNHPQGKVYDGHKCRLAMQHETMESICVHRIWTYIAANRGFLKRTLGYVSYMLSASLAVLKLPRPDIIVATSPQFFCACAGFLTSRLLRCPWVFEVRDIWPESIVAVDAHAGDPHHAPHPEADRAIGPDSVLMLDLWAKETGPESIYADMTWMAWTGSAVPSVVQQIWEAVRDGRDAALDLVRERFSAGKRVEGWELDRAARDLIVERGFGEAFVHRTGHSLGVEDHGDGANLDDLECHDTRPLLPGTGFTIEPGIYLPTLGIRSEIDVYLGPGGPEVTTPIQIELDCLQPS